MTSCQFLRTGDPCELHLIPRGARLRFQRLNILAVLPMVMSTKKGVKATVKHDLEAAGHDAKVAGKDVEKAAKAAGRDVKKAGAKIRKKL